MDVKPIPQVFVSHASADCELIEPIVNELAKHDIEVWASFKDIPPGREWDEAIEGAMREASHVLVMVSPESVKSRYVRAEVEKALNDGKIVIPVIIVSVELPLRWHTLQYVDYQNDSTKAIELLVGLLPKTILARIRQLLDTPGQFDELRDLLCESAHLLSPFAPPITSNDLRSFVDQIQDNRVDLLKFLRAEFKRNHPYNAYKLMNDLMWEEEEFRYFNLDFSLNPSNLTQNYVTATLLFLLHHDCLDLVNGVDFLELPDASNLTLIMCFLASPYEPPARNNSPSAELQTILERTHTTTRLLLDKHLRAEMRITIYAGRRVDYDEELNSWRNHCAQSWMENYGDTEDPYFLRPFMEIASYDRLYNDLARQLT